MSIKYEMIQDLFEADTWHVVRTERISDFPAPPPYSTEKGSWTDSRAITVQANSYPEALQKAKRKFGDK